MQTGGDLVWRRAVIHWTRGEASASPEDDAVCTFDIANVTNSEIDGSWTAGDYAACDSAFGTFMTSISAYQSVHYQANEVRYYRMQFASPMTFERRFVPSGPPEHVFPFAAGGAAAGDALPPQVAFSVTEKTAIPRHWGRFYLPGFAEGMSAGISGRWLPNIVDEVAAITRNLYQSLGNSEFFPVVASTQVDKLLAGSLIGVTHVGADDIPDVIRRRRHEDSTHKVFLP